MNRIEVKLVNALETDLELMTQLVCAITRGANKYSSVDDLINWCISNKWNNEKVVSMTKLPHSKINRFTRFVFVIANASRRFLAQLNTHQLGINIDYMSGSLQYSNHAKQSLANKFVVPYALLNNDIAKEKYLSAQEHSFNEYCDLITNYNIDNDSAGYIMPEGLRNIVLVSVNIEELKYIGTQRLCRRNSPEIRYIVAKMIESVCNSYNLDYKMFLPKCCGEGPYSCGKAIKVESITDLIAQDFPILCEVK